MPASRLASDSRVGPGRKGDIAEAGLAGYGLPASPGKNSPMLRRLLLLLFIAVSGMALTNLAAADPVFPLGLRVGLEPPPGMVPSKRFPGFEDPEHKAIITILDLPAAAYPQLEQSGYNTIPPRTTVQSRTMFAFHSGIGILIRAQTKGPDAVKDRWILLASAAPATNLATLITVEMPEAARSVYPDAAIRKALASVTFRAAPIAEQVKRLPFKLNELAGFRVLEVLSSGGVVITDGPTNDLAKQAYMVISVGAGAPERVEDRARFARDILSSAPVRDLKFTYAEAMRLDGLPGYEIRADAVDLRGHPIALVQWLRFGGTGFARIIGITPKDQWDKVFDRFRAVRDGMNLR
jgi:hypothetical protein